MIQVRTDVERQGVVLEVDGALDAQGADELATVASEQPPALHVVIDLSRAQVAQDAVLGRLVDALPAARSRSLRGLGRGHHARLLKYLGESVELPDVEE